MFGGHPPNPNSSSLLFVIMYPSIIGVTYLIKVIMNCGAARELGYLYKIIINCGAARAWGGNESLCDSLV